MPSASNYIRYDHPSLEHGAGPEEDKLINEIARQINTAQQGVLDAHHHAFSGTHVKTHGVVKGTFTVLPDLPAHLAQSMFATPGTHDMAMRFSSEPTDLVPDTMPAPRGIGIKVFSVDGAKLRQDGKDPKTQDFEFNSSPVLELGNAQTCRDIIALRLQHGDPIQLSAQLKKRDDFDIQDGRNRAPNQHVFCQRQYSQAAYRYGDYVAKYALVPSPDSPQAKYVDKVINSSDDDAKALRAGLTDFLANNALEFDFQVQLLQNIDEQSIEDVRRDWSQEKYPFQTVAKVHVPQQDPYLPGRVNYWRDQIRVDVWHGLQDLKPLGSINRVRKTVYKASAAFRRRANGHIKEVTVEKIDDIPDN